MKKDKIVLAYSGGLDTSVAIKWLADKYKADIVTVTIDVGQGGDLEEVREKALKVGAVNSVLIDVKKEFVEGYIKPAIKANAAYEDSYLLATALSRPLMAKYLVEVAVAEDATFISHGCTGKGNDQVRFDVSIKAINPTLKIIAPARGDWNFTRTSAIEYAKTHGIPLEGVTQSKKYSIDMNLWGRSIECGVLEDAWQEPPEDAYEMTASPASAPDKPTYVTIEFDKGVPVSIDDKKQSLLGIIEALNVTAGANGIGRVDHIESRLVGIKSREVYECPAATVIYSAHKALESMVMVRDMGHFKKTVEQKYSELVYYGLWYSPMRQALDAFINNCQQTVTGKVKVKLFKGAATVVGIQSPYSLYDHGLATYEVGDVFNHKAAEGFISLWGLELQTYAKKLEQVAALHKTKSAVCECALAGK